ANRESALVVQAPGPRRIAVERLSPGVHALTTGNLDDPDDPRIQIARETLDPAQFMTSAQRICRDERIVVAGRERGTVSSSLVLVGGDICFHHLLGDPRVGAYEMIRPFEGGRNRSPIG